MILAHCMQFFVYLHEVPAARIISDYVNLTTFSGFVFVFGYVSYHAYLQKDFKDSYPRVRNNILKLLGAFYLSSFAYVVFRQDAFYGWDTFWDIVLIRKLAGYSEFLLSFAIIMLACLILHPLLQKITQKTAMKWIGMSLFLTLIPYGNVHPLIGTIIGGTNFAYFSVVQYFSLFVIGVIFAKYQIGWHKGVCIGAFVGSGIFLIFLVIFGHLPSRFPVSALWIIGSFGFLYGYYLLALKTRASYKTAWLAQIGQRSLYYLLLSNIFIFALTRTNLYRTGVLTALLLFVTIIYTCYYLKRKV